MYGKYFQHFMLLTFYLLFVQSLVPAGAEEVDVIMATLRGNPKLAAADKILADFERGAPETPVIVTLRPSKEAKALEDRSRSSPKVPPEFTGPGAAPFYNLQDDSIRSQLEATVAATVGRVLAQLGPEGITVTRKFSYLFGFAARVTPAALARVVALPEVVCVEKDHSVKPHPAAGIAPSKQSLHWGLGSLSSVCAQVRAGRAEQLPCLHAPEVPAIAHLCREHRGRVLERLTLHERHGEPSLCLHMQRLGRLLQLSLRRHETLEWRLWLQAGDRLWQ